MQKKTPNQPHSESPHIRENYEDHSLKFLDWVNHLGFERTRVGRSMAFIESKFQISRFALVFLYSLLLGYALNFEIRTPVDYQVGDIAKSDIIAPLSFEMVDQVTTEDKRLKAEATVPIIFDFDPGVFERVSGSIYRSFRLMRIKSRNMAWPRSASAREEKVKEFFIHKGEFDKELGITIPDYLFEWLVENRFSARVENILIRNLDKWLQERIVDGPERLIPVQRNFVLARVIQKNARGKEFNIPRKDILDSGNIELFTLRDNKGLEKANQQERANILSLARLLIVPNLTLNKQEMTSRKQQARETVLPATMSIKKNQTIVKEGESLQASHMAVLKEIEALKSDRRRDVMWVSMGLMFLAMIVVFSQYLRRFTGAKTKIDSKDFAVMSVVLLGTVLMTKIFWFMTETAFVSKFGSWLPTTVFLFLAPVASGPMLVGLVIQSGEVVWLFTAFTAIVMGMMTEMNFTVMLVTLAGGIAAARGVYSCKKRSDIYWAGVRTGLVSAMVIALMLTISKMNQPVFMQEILTSVPAGFLGGILSSLVAMMIIPLLESTFNYTTDVKLLELSNLNHPLLKDMIVRAPGTYHHSMMVGSMVEAAAEEIGANPLLGKVMCYYHDIGKMEHANYFIENQKPGQNPHDHISPYMSKTLLIAHVKDGVELGMKYQLGKPIIDGVLQHHGTTLISYFYNKAIDLKGDDDPEVEEGEFRYPGPKPQFREAALCMLADSIEAAARSLDEPTPTRLQNIVRNIIQRKFMDGQLDECNLSLRDLSKVELAFSRILLGIYHQRIDYPRSAGGGAGESAAATLFGETKNS